MMRAIYVLLLVTMLLFVANCDCTKTKSQRYGSMWVSCLNTGSSASPTYTPTLMFYSGNDAEPVPKGLPTQVEFNNNGQYTCPSTTGSSPPWPQSHGGVYPPGPEAGPLINVRPRATGSSSTVAYLPPLLLDLPFTAQASTSDIASPTCYPSRPDVLAVNHDSATVARITTCPFSAITTIPVAQNPLQIAFTPDGTTALVTSYYNAVNFINLANNQVTFTLSTPGIYPNGVAVTPDGQNMYITNFLPTGASLVEYSLSTHQQIFSVATPTYPQSVKLSPDGAQLYVTFPYANLVWVVDTATNTVSYQLSISVPRDVAFNSHGTKAYIASADNGDLAVVPGKVVEFDTGTFAITRTFNVDIGPTELKVLSLDQTLIVNNYEGGSVSSIDLASGAVTTTAMGGAMAGLAVVQ